MNQSFTLKKGLMTIMSILLFVVVQAQTKKISGKVTADDDHSSLPGVSVTIKGTTRRPNIGRWILQHPGIGK
jgi:hypothetical protein